MARRVRPPITRRDALKGLAASAVAAGCRPEPHGAPPAEGFDLLRQRIDTVVVLMMENRSFDHYFGALSLEEGRTDVDGLAADMSNPDPDGVPVHPFHTAVDCLADPPHSWNRSHAQFNGGANDGFVREMEDANPGFGPEAMGYLTRADLPALYALADAYTLCDRWFASLMTSTQPNRFYFHCGQNDGVTNNDPPVGKDYPSIYTVLAQHGLTWGVYYGNAPGVLLLPDRKLGEPQIRPIDDFFAHAAAGTLPHLVFVEPVYGMADDHPPAHPTAGQLFIAQVYEALASSPQWERLTLFITYDEHGGFHDHVPPPTAPDDFADLGFDQLGFRVPGLAIGPWVKPGHVSHVVYDHTSALGFIERLFDVGHLSLRSSSADPMLDCFDFDALRKGLPLAPVALDPIVADPAELYRDACVDDRVAFITGQDTLEAYLVERFPTHPKNRIPATARIHRALVDRAFQRGLAVRR